MKTSIVLAILACVGLTVSAPPKNDVLCDGCVALTQVIQDHLEQDLPLDELEEIVREGCSALPDPLADICKNKLIPAVYNIYHRFEDASPVEICTVLDLCETN
ncbi:uncharacterized protein LOC114329033 [Diabrotica virgifera virgifera]|uniref:Saposin B-type domain-containing protein n=1 Tax=Diabrotica virgifera virgifera TaxID=50390 RepID=A0ABM5KAA7_DIAVI|nr:uncharacterized protein LOC114329033 [Diabrotica virgifera virgifera]